MKDCLVRRRVLWFKTAGSKQMDSTLHYLLGNASRFIEKERKKVRTQRESVKCTLFWSLQWLRSLSWRRRAAEAHCAAILRIRLFMKLSDSFPVPTCSRRVPMSDWKTAWVTGMVQKINFKSTSNNIKIQVTILFQLDRSDFDCNFINPSWQYSIERVFKCHGISGIS